MPPKGSDLIFDHRHNADERRLLPRPSAPERRKWRGRCATSIYRHIQRMMSVHLPEISFTNIYDWNDRIENISSRGKTKVSTLSLEFTE